MNADKTQAALILEHLRRGNTLTPVEALDRFGCFRLGARIWELVRAGAPIGRRMVRVVSERSGKPCRVAEYFFKQASA